MRDLERLIAGVASERISRRQFVQRGLALGLSTTVLSTLLSACGETAEETVVESLPALDSTKPEKLVLYNWADYLPQSVVDTFQDRTGIPVTMAYYENNEALLAKLKAGGRGYDLCFPGDYMVSVLFKSGLLEPLHMDLIPNFKNIAQSMQKPKYDPEEDGTKYSVPYQWGTTGIGVRADLFSTEITSWADLWDVQNSGKVQMLDDERETLAVGLKLLGYSLNTTSQDELDEAVAKLIEQKPLVLAYTSANVARPLISGVPLVHIYDGDCRRAMSELGVDKVKFVLPEEGFSMWTDNLCIPVGGTSPYWAHKFVDFLCETEIAAEVSNYTGYLSPVPSTTELLDPLLQASTPDPAVLERGEGILDLGEFNRSYSEGWQKVRTA